ncbi:MAG: glycosyltransferase, partial [Pseudomonadota bacterium]
ILALVRFAYPGLGAFQIEHRTVEARMAHLWAPERMRARLRTLEHVCLRTLARQTDPDFRVLVITGDALPQPWRGELERIAGGVPQVELIYHRPMQQRHAYEEIVNARIERRGPPVIQFRQDDDDGVALDFVERCRAIFQEVRPLWERSGRLAVDFNRGFAYRATAEGPLVEPQVKAHLGVAQALILRPRIRRTALHFPHHRIAETMAALSITDRPMWLRGVDGTNDSPVRTQVDRLRPATAEERSELETRFGLDLAALAGRVR